MNVKKFYSPDDVEEYLDDSGIPDDPDDWGYNDYRHELMYAVHGVPAKGNGIVPFSDGQHPLVPVEAGYAEADSHTLEPADAVDAFEGLIEDFDPENPTSSLGGDEADPDAQLSYYNRMVRLFTAMQNVELGEVRRYDAEEDRRAPKNGGVTIAEWKLTDATSALIVREETKATFMVDTRFYVEFTRKPEKKIDAIVDEYVYDTERTPVVPVTADAAQPA